MLIDLQAEYRFYKSRVQQLQTIIPRLQVIATDPLLVDLLPIVANQIESLADLVEELPHMPSAETYRFFISEVKTCLSVVYGVPRDMRRFKLDALSSEQLNLLIEMQTIASAFYRRMNRIHIIIGVKELLYHNDPITIFGDIHGNLAALEAVFADMETRNADQNLYCLGDLVGYGTFPNPVIDAVRSRAIPTIMGNYDQGVGHNSDDCGCAYNTPEAQALGERSIAWSNAHTTDDNKTYLRELRDQIRLQLGDYNLLLVHGSPRKINEYLYEDRPDASFERILDAAEADVLVCGHTHLPYHKILPSGRHVINAGSVGKPKDEDNRAGYLVLSIDENNQLNAEFVRVPYDIERTATAIEASDMPDEFAQMLRAGRG